MGNAFPSAGFGGQGFGDGRPGTGWPLSDVADGLRSIFEQRVGPRVGRGDVRAAILVLLAEQPMHGYQLIAEIERRSGGAWRPSAGSVYPTLQLLADEGLIDAEAADGRKTYSLTETGKAEAAAAAERGMPWETPGQRGFLGVGHALPKAGVALAQAAAQLGRTGTPEQIEEAVEVLDEARRRLYSILAQG